MNILEVFKVLIRSKLLYASFFAGILSIIAMHFFIDYIASNTKRTLTTEDTQNLLMLRTLPFALHIGIMMTYFWAVPANGYKCALIRKMNFFTYILSYFSIILIPIFLLGILYLIKYEYSLLYLAASFLVSSFSFFVCYVVSLFSRYDYELTSITSNLSSRFTYTFLPVLILVLARENFFNIVSSALEFVTPKQEVAFFSLGSVFLLSTLYHVLKTPGYIRKAKYEIVKNLE